MDELFRICNSGRIIDDVIITTSKNESKKYQDNGYREVLNPSFDIFKGKNIYVLVKYI